jgi:hypothetical protein
LGQFVTICIALLCRPNFVSSTSTRLFHKDGGFNEAIYDVTLINVL